MVIVGFRTDSEFGMVVRELYGDAGCDATNNTAEYTALVHGLSCIATTSFPHPIRDDIKTLTVCGDAELVIRQMRFEYAVDNPRLQCFHARAFGLDAQLRAAGIPVRYVHIPRDRNTAADALATRGLEHPGRKYNPTEVVMFHPNRSMVSAVSFDGEAPATPASNDLGAIGGGYHLIDAETVLQHPTLGPVALRNLKSAHPIEVCVGAHGRLTVLGALSTPLSVRFHLDITPGTPPGCTSIGSFEAHAKVLVVDHLPVPFHLTVSEGGGFPQDAIRYGLHRGTVRFEAARFPPTFRERPFWTTNTMFLPFFT